MLNGCGETSIPDQLGIEVGDNIAVPPQYCFGNTVRDIQGNFVLFIHSDPRYDSWINLEDAKYIRLCQKANGERHHPLMKPILPK